MSVTASTPRVAGRAWRGLLLSVFVVALACLVGFTATPAGAAEPPAIAPASIFTPGPITLGETLGAPAGQLLVRGVGACIGTVAACAIVGAAAIGLGLYATKDSWLPIVKGAVNGAYNFLTGNGNTGTSGCALLVSAPEMGTTAMTVNVSHAGGCGLAGNWWLIVQNVYCGDGVNSTVGPLFTGVNGTVEATGSFGYAGASAGTLTTPALCPAGMGVIGAVVWARNYGGAQDWYSDHHQYGASTSDASTSITTNVQCRKADGTLATASGTITGRSDQLPIPSCEAAYPGSFPESVNVTTTGAGVTRPLGDLVPNVDVKENYPDCFGPDGAYLNTCRVRVYINGAPCVSGMAGCNDPETYADDNPGTDWSCRWGPYIVAKSACAPLKNHYGGQTQTITTTRPDGSPETDPLAPPAPAPTINWQDTCLLGPCVNAPPTTPDPPTAPDTQTCMNGVALFNPVSWVLIPVKCALTWAFVPKVAPSFTDIANPLPTGWLPTLPSLSDGSCGVVSMPSLQLGFAGGHTAPTTLFDTCQAPWPLVRTFTYNGLLALVLVTVIRAAFRAVMNALGMGVEAAAAASSDP